MKHLKMLEGIPPNFGTKKEQTPWLLPFFSPDIDPLKLSLTIPQDHARGARGLEDNFTTGKGDSQRVYGQLGKVVSNGQLPSGNDSHRYGKIHHAINGKTHYFNGHQMIANC